MNKLGHGHVFPRPDGVKARCGGPALCAVCREEQQSATASVSDAVIDELHLKRVELDEVAVGVPTFKSLVGRGLRIGAALDLIDEQVAKAAAYARAVRLEHGGLRDQPGEKVFKD